MAKRYINFLIVPEGNPKSLKFKLSLFVTRVTVCVLGFLVVFVLILSILHGKLLYQVVVGKSLKQENEKLKRYNAKVVELEKELAEHKRFVRRVAQLAGAESQGYTEDHMTQHTEDAVPQETMMADSVGKREVMALPSPDSAAAWSDSLSHIPTGTPIAGWITQEFSMNISGFGGEHPGLDFAAKTGTEVKTTADGQVSFVGWDEIYGFLVAIDHQNGYQTFYGHNSKILVEVGDNVRRGEVIALSGNTGRSSAPHLHYEIRQNEVPVNPSSSINRH